MRATIKKLLVRVALLEATRNLLDANSLVLQRLRWSAGRRFGAHDRRIVDAYLAGDAPRKLHLGAGNYELPDWLNSDLYPRSPTSIHIDARGSFPLPDASFDYVFSNHMFEHLSYLDGTAMLRECLRVLAPGGILRVSTPDLAFLLNVYRDPDDALHQRYIDWHRDWINRENSAAAPSRAPIFVVNNFVRDWGHQFIYDREAMRQILECAGFAPVIECGLNESSHAALRGIGNEARAPAGLLDAETMTFEAQKPLEPGASETARNEFR